LPEATMCIMERLEETIGNKMPPEGQHKTIEALGGNIVIESI
jgi:hypothetical protein